MYVGPGHGKGASLWITHFDVSTIPPSQAEALFAYAKQRGHNAQTSLYGLGGEGTVQPKSDLSPTLNPCLTRA